MKKILVSVGIVSVLAGVAFLVVDGQRARTTHPNGEPSTQSTAGGGKIAGDSAGSTVLGSSGDTLGAASAGSPGARVATPYVPSAPAGSMILESRSGTIAALSLFPRNVDRSLAPLFHFAEQLRKTGVWKASGIEEKFLSGLEEGWNKQQNAGETTKLTREQALALWRSSVASWNDATEILIALRPNSAKFKINQRDVPLPKILVGIQYRDTESAKRHFDELVKSIQSAGPIEQLPGVTIQRGDEKEAVTIGSEETGVSGGIHRRGARMYSLVAESDENVFFTTAPAERIDAESVPAQRAWSAVPDPAVLYYANSPLFLSAVESFIAAAPKDSEVVKGMESGAAEMFALYRQFVSVAGGMGSELGSNYVSCVDTVPGSRMSAVFRESIPESGAGDRTGERLQFPRLLDENTIFGVGARSAIVSAQLKMMIESWRTSFEGTAITPENRAEFEGWITKAETVFSKFSFREYGVIVSPPILPPIIGVGLYFGGSTLKGEMLLKEFAAAANDLAKTVRSVATKYGTTGEAGTPPSDIATVVKRSDGSLVLDIVLGGLKVVGVLAGNDDSVIVTIDHSIAREFRRRLQEDNGFLRSLLSTSGITINPDGTEYISVLNSKVFVDVIRGVVPFLLAQQSGGPNAQLSPKDVDEVLNLLRVTIVSFQRSTREGELVCTTTTGAVVGGNS